MYCIDIYCSCTYMNACLCILMYIHVSIYVCLWSVCICIKIRLVRKIYTLEFSKKDAGLQFYG